MALDAILIESEKYNNKSQIELTTSITFVCSMNKRDKMSLYKIRRMDNGRCTTNTIQLIPNNNNNNRNRLSTENLFIFLIVMNIDWLNMRRAISVTNNLFIQRASVKLIL